LSVKECALKKAAVECEKEGRTNEKDKNNAITAFLGLIAKKLGMSLKAEFTDKGCKMVIGK